MWRRNLKPTKEVKQTKNLKLELNWMIRAQEIENRREKEMKNGLQYDIEP